MMKRDLTAVGIAAGGRDEVGRMRMELMGRMIQPQPIQPTFYPNQPVFHPARMYPQLQGQARQGQMMSGSQAMSAMMVPPPVAPNAPQENTGQVEHEIGSSY